MVLTKDMGLFHSMADDDWDSLIRIMEERGTNPRRLSLAAGLGETAVSDILHGRSKNPRYETLSKIAFELGCTVHDIMVSIVEPNQTEVNAITDERVDRLKINGWIQGDGSVAIRPKLLSDLQRSVKSVTLPDDFQSGVYSAYIIDDAMMFPFRKDWVIFFRDATLEECVDQFCLATLDGGGRYFKVLRKNGDSYDLDHTTPVVEVMKDVKITSIMIMALVAPVFPSKKRSD